MGLERYSVPDDRRYTRTHEWALLEDGLVRVGVTDYAQQQLHDVVMVSLPEPGDEFSAGDAAAALDSVKTSADVYAPVSGVVEQVNRRLEQEPELINRDPYGDGWIFVLRMSRPEEYGRLMTPDEYREMLRGE